MRISVIGTGYLGAVHAACMASLGHEVVGYDTDSAKVEALSRGSRRSSSRSSRSCCESALATGQLRFTGSAEEAVRGATVHFICVGTPQQSGSDAADLRFVDAAVQTVADLADCDGLIVGKSTVPVGTAQRLADRLGSDGPRLELAWNPEFLREGMAVRDTLHPDRLVFGVTSEHAEKSLLEVYGEDHRRRHAVHHHRFGDGGDGQGGRERLSGHQDLVHQRDGRGLRGGQRRRRHAQPRRWATTSGSVVDSSTPASGLAADVCQRTSAPSALGRASWGPPTP